MKSFLELLGERGDDPELTRSFLPVAVDELRRVERLLDTMTELHRGASDGDAGNASEAVAAVSALLAPRAQRLGVQLEAGCDAPLPSAALGPDGLRQVLLNLALNALEASPRGGRVRIAARTAPGGLELVVADEGPGLGAATRRGGTDEARGRGRGLAITRRLLKASGGQLGFGTAAGGGAELRAFVPAGPRAPGRRVR